MIDLVKKAIEKLNTNKGLHISFEDFKNLIDGGFELKLTDTDIGVFFVSFSLSDICKSREPYELEISSIENLRLLRIAKKIYTVYKQLLGDTVDTLTDQTITGAKTISAINSGGITYSIVDNRFDNLNDEIKILKDINNRLTNEVDYLKAVLQAKGIL